jgi:HPt (histidine-containing phosphotransfer) domain-containing protein
MTAADVDFSLLPDVLTEVREHLPALEQDLHRLVGNPDAADLLASAFRHVHTIKGDFGYCHATPIMDFVHKLESVLQTLRDRRYQCSALVAEALLQSMDQVTAMSDVLARTGEFDTTSRDALIALIEQLAAASEQDEADQLSRRILMLAHGEWLAEPLAVKPPVARPSDESIQRALAMGEQLASALAQRIPNWRGRTLMQGKLVLAMNERHVRAVDATALRIAVLWHDVGLLSLSDTALRKAPTPKSVNWQAYAAHPERAATWLLSIAPDCAEAAQIIRQHHLWHNGTGLPALGYPLPPHPGAQMLACADLLHDRVAGLHGEDYRRGVLRAVFDVNGGLETQFDAAVINAFQAVARDLKVPGKG